MSIQLLLFILFIGAFLLHLSYLAFYLLPLTHSLVQDKGTDYTFPNPHKLAIIIAVQNEEDVIHRLLNCMEQQSYPHYEVHVVDDYSIDKTPSIVREFCRKNNAFHYHKNPGIQGKKHALRFGIENADCKILLFTDADCVPLSKNWASSMVLALGDKEICLGYGKYAVKGGFLNDFIQFETGMIACQYMGFAGRGMPYMGVGRNLMYRKSLFMKSDRYKSHEEMRSGDDDLFVMQYAGKENTAYNLDPESFTISDPPCTWLELIGQKRRHLTTSVKYPLALQWRLGTIILSNMYFYILAVAIYIFYPDQILIIIGLLILKWVLDMIVYSKLFQQLKIGNILLLFPLMDLVLSAYYFFLTPFLFYRKNERW